MPWPQANEFQDAVLNPQASFLDEDLRGAKVAVDGHGMPIPASGQFGIVYQMTSGTGRWAIKCFTSPMPGREERYRRISAHLKAAKLPFMVGFEFLEKGIYIDEQWYPILKMDWVEGATLNQVVEEHIDKPDKLKSLTEIWVRIARHLQNAKITHADLQHGNVMLIPKPNIIGSLKLVDYDGMYLPSLAGTQSGEVGHPTYQHPKRLTEGYYGPEVDRFPQLVIYTAMHALAEQGRDLWVKYNHGDNLLFAQADFGSPAKSKVLKELWKNGREDLRRLTGWLVLATRMPIQKVPALEFVLEENGVRALSSEQVAAVHRILALEAPNRDANSTKASDTDSYPVAQPAPKTGGAFLDALFSPLTLAPMALGMSVIILATIVPPPHRNYGFFGGALAVVIGLGMLVSQWLLAGDHSTRK